MWVNTFWYRRRLHFFSLLLLPFSFLFFLIVCLRRYCYQKGLAESHQLSVPVIIVGNITVGGTGKTPFVIWLANFLHSLGLSPGIITRGVGGKKWHEPHLVTAQDKAQDVGDEAILLAQTNCPVMVCASKLKAARKLLAEKTIDIIISDDGLQHYRLRRDIEIAIVDGERYFGNRQLLPAGPLREPVSRLKNCDLVVVNGNSNEADHMQLEAKELVSLVDKNITKPLSYFQNKQLHAVAGIGNPVRFFKMLQDYGLHIISHAFKDHYLFSKQDFFFAKNLPVLMTEKDAVKCYEFADDRFWFVRHETKVSKSVEIKLLQQLHAKEVSYAQ